MRAPSVTRRWRSRSVRYSADCRTTPTCRYSCCHSVSKISMVTSVYGEFSMSIQTKNPAGSARFRIFRRLSMALALSTSSPSYVSLRERLRPMPDAMTASMMRRYSRVDASASAAVLEGLGGSVGGLLAAGVAEVGVPSAELLDEPIDAALEVASGDRRPHGRGEDRGREHLVQRADTRANEARQGHHVASRLRVALSDRNRRPEGDERARAVAHGVADHLGQLAGEGALAFFHPLPREHVILEHEVVGDGHRHDDEV